MRHQTATLTVGAYTDRTGLGTAEAIASMSPLLGQPSQVASHKIVPSGPSVAFADITSTNGNAAESLIGIEDRHALTLADAACHKNNLAASLGLEPRCFCTPA